jgi:hypothetical protein
MVYLIEFRRPLIASCFITLAISIKVGALLLIPTFLGTIQYQFGPTYLIFAVLIILGWQIGIALPFCNDWAAYHLGFENAKTSLRTYLENAMFIRHRNRLHGAMYMHSTHWQIIE